MKPEELSRQLRDAELAMLKAKRAMRPIKDALYPSVEDREVEMSGRAAEQIAEFHHLERLWQAYMEELTNKE